MEFLVDLKVDFQDCNKLKRVRVRILIFLSSLKVKKNLSCNTEKEFNVFSQI